MSVGSWYNPHKGAGQPSADLGGVGDTYLDTTNNVYYVKTESGWMDTKGSSALPSTSIGVAGRTVRAKGDGTGYELVSRDRSIYTTVSGHTYGGISCLKIFTATGIFHCSFTIDIVPHGYRGIEGRLDFVGSTVGGGSYKPSLHIMKSWDWRDSTYSVPELKIYKDSSNNFYIGWLNKSADGVRFSIRNFSTDNPITLNANPSSADYIKDAATIATFTEIPVDISTGVERSTASNQVLVSDGNGGWSASVWVPVPACTSADAGKVLKVNSSGVPEWTTA